MPKFVGAIDVNGAYTLPTADGSANQVLKTDGSGTVSFANEAGGGGSPGGSNTQIQFNNSDSFGGSANFTFDGTSTVTLASTDAGSSAAPIIELYRNSSSPADADYLGQIKFQGEDDGGAKVNYAKITAKIDDASNTTEDGIIEIAHMKAGSNNISARFTSTALKLINGTGLEVADGLLTLGSTAVTATAAELNILDGVTATASELNILDGVTSTTAELNILDGVTSTASELNLLDGITAGTVSASLAVIVDSNKDISGFRNITSSGTGDITTKFEVLSDTEAHSGALAFYKSEAAGAARLDINAVYGRLDFYGRTASDGYYLSSQIKSLVGSSFSSDNQAPSDIEFSVTPVGQTAPVKKLVIKGGTSTTDSAALQIWHPGGDNKGGRVDFIDHDGTSLGYFGFSNNANWYIKNTVSSGNMFIESEGTIYIRAEGNYELSATANGLEPYTDSGYKLGSSSKKFSEIHGDAIHIGGTEVTATAAELNIMDGVTATATELNIMDGVTSTTAELNILDGVTSTAAELNILDGVTSTTAELNILDGVTSTTAELNILDGVTSTTAELNILDGVTSTTAELNILDGVTSTASELNLVDGITAGTVAASKAVIADSNKDVTGFRNIATTGTVTVGNTTGPILSEGNANSLRIDTGDGTVDIGPMNTGNTHFYTNTENIAFGTTPSGGSQGVDNIITDTAFYPYVDDKQTLGITSKAWKVVYTKDGADTAPAYSFGSDTDTGMYRYGANQLGFTVGGDAIAYFEQGNGSGYGGLVIADTSETISDGGIRIGTWKDSTYSGVFMDGHTGSEYMMISNGGSTFVSAGSGSNVYIRAGNNDSTNELTVSDGVLEFDFDSYVKWNTPLPVVSGYSTLRRKNSTFVVGYDGSSIRYKENVTPFVKSDWEKIYNLQAVRFNWKAEIDEDQNRSWGFISEEVYEQIPELGVMRVVEGVNDGNPVPDTVNYEQMCVFLVEAIKDLNTRLTALEG